MFLVVVDLLNCIWFELDLVVIFGDLMDEGIEDEYWKFCELFVELRWLFVVLLGNYDDCGNLWVVFLDYVWFLDEGVFLFVLDVGELCVVVLDIFVLGLYYGELDVEILVWFDIEFVEYCNWMVVIVMYYLLFMIGIFYFDIYGLWNVEVFVVVFVWYSNVDCIFVGYVYWLM